MKAMILAAGLGTRLRPLTNDRPKALVEVAGRTLLQIALNRLSAFGVREVIINIHHHADMILECLRANDNFGMSIEVSREETLLDTGGGLKRAAHFFLRDAASGEQPFILHNVDVISLIDLGRMVRFHSEHGALATLAVQDRPTQRYLVFDHQGGLRGRSTGPTAEAEAGNERNVPTAAPLLSLAFSGIHVISPRLFSKMEEEGAFSIIEMYLRLVAQGEKILAFRADGSYWRDLGRPADIAQAAQDLSQSS